MKISTRWIDEKRLLEINVENFCTSSDELITSKQEAEWLISNLESVINDLKEYAKENK